MCNALIICLCLLKASQTTVAYCNNSAAGRSSESCSDYEGTTVTSPVHEPLTTQADPTRRTVRGSEDFARLKLNRKELLGSRWAIEQGSAIDVYNSIDIVDATLITKDELILRVEFNLRQTWVAEGLEFPDGLFKEEDANNSFITAGEEVLAYMWSPDSYISTSRESNINTVGTPLSLVYIYKNATIIFKVRMFTKVACSSSFQWYPLDIQTCHLTIESYKFHHDIVRYHWTDEKMYRPVVVHNRRLFQYELQTPPNRDSGTVSRGGRGMNYSYVRVKFRFERKLGNNLIQVYTPTVLVVVLSWFSFWLGLDAIPGRISLLITSMLTLVTMHSGMKSSIPPVHYITMMDIWYVYCMAFVFSAMTEFVIAKYLHWRCQQKWRLEERIYEEEVRAKFYGIFKPSEQPSGLLWCEPKRFSARSLPDNRSELALIRETKKRVGILPLDKVTAFASSCRTNSAGGESLRRKQVTGDYLRFILVGRDHRDIYEFDEVAEGKIEDEEEGTTGNVKGDETKQTVPMWVSMDKVCRTFLPFLFFLFNGVYWPVLILGSAAQDTEVYLEKLNEI